MVKIKQKGYVIGVDGGGTKTLAILADLEGKILRKVKSGPSSFIKAGLKESVFNITDAIEKILKDGKGNKVISTFIALAAIEENKEIKRVILKELSLQPKISQIFRGKVIIDSDQIAAFRSGSDKRDGVVLIAGTGCAAHGWQGKKEFHASGWGWLNDEGSAFWVGQEAYRAVLKDLDGRGARTLMTGLFLKKFNVKDAGGLKRKIHFQNNPIKIVPLLSILADEAAIKKDKIACSILKEAGRELGLAVNTVIKKLDFKKQEFPVVLTGGMFKSKIVLETVKKEIKKYASGANFILPKKDPVVGAIKLALENK